MLNIYRVDHICQVVPELEPQLALMEGLFGFRRVQEWKRPEEGACGVTLDVPGSWGHRWELQAPLGSDSPLQKFLDSPSGPGIHHVAVEVTDMHAALEELDALGITEDRRTWAQAMRPAASARTGALSRMQGFAARSLMRSTFRNWGP